MKITNIIEDDAGLRRGKAECLGFESAYEELGKLERAMQDDANEVEEEMDGFEVQSLAKKRGKEWVKKQLEDDTRGDKKSI